MLIETKAKDLVDMLYSLSKVHGKTDSIRSILLENNEGKLSLASSGTYGLSQGLVNAAILDNGKSVFVPTTVIPFLQNLGDLKVKMNVDESQIVITFNKNKISVNQITHLDGVVTKPVETPEWLVSDLSRLRDILYATEQSDGGSSIYRSVFVYGDMLLATDRFRMASYKPVKFHSDKNFIVDNGVFKLISNDSIRLGVGDCSIRLGSDILYTSHGLTFCEPPQAIVNLINQPITDEIMINKDEFVRNILMTKDIVNKDVPTCRTYSSNGVLSIVATSEKGDVYAEQEILSGTLELNMLFSAFFLNDIAKVVKETLIGISKVGPTMCIRDGEVSHYILPRN